MDKHEVDYTAAKFEERNPFAPVSTNGLPPGSRLSEVRALRVSQYGL
jgi:hypothetical protein